MPKATKLTATQVLVLRNIRDYGFHAATGFHGMSERGGAVKSVDSLRRRGLVDGPHRNEHLTEEGEKVLAEIEAARDVADMAVKIRRLLRVAGYIELGAGGSTWGWSVKPGTTPGVVRVDYTPRLASSSVKIGNGRVAEYVRTLQANGFDVRRVPGVTKVDSLLVMLKK
jgi:hypothetical protein